MVYEDIDIHIDDDNFVYHGPKGRIEPAYKSDGTQPVTANLAKLKKRDYRRFSKFKAVFVQFIKAGELPRTKLEKYSGHKHTVWKFKHSETFPLRICCFEYKGTFYLTHIFDKGGNKVISNNIRIAEGIKKEHIQYLLKGRPEK